MASFCISAGIAERLENNPGFAGNCVQLRGYVADESITLVNRCAQNANKKADAHQFQRIDEKNGRVTAEYGCVNFNNDPLRINFSITTKALAEYKQGYGYAQSDLDALSLWKKKALQEAYDNAVKKQLGQARLNKMSAAIKAEYQTKYRDFMIAHGFTALDEYTMVMSVPVMVKRNVSQLHQVAQQLGSIAEKQKYDADKTIAAALSLVQTAIRFENVPMTIQGWQTGGMYPPVETIARGKGDCDSKTALLASILLNWDKIKLVGVALPTHYLMGVLRSPVRGDAFIEYKGLRYVLMEPAGAAWLPPGSVSPGTEAFLKSGRSFVIEPLKAI